MKLLRAVLLMLVGAVCARAQLTTVADTIYNADGSKYSGTAIISWPVSFVGGDGRQMLAAPPWVTTSIKNGVLNVQLEANSTSTPTGTYYSVTLRPAALGVGPMIWIVPYSATPLPLSAVMVAVPPTPSFTIALSQLAQTGATTGQCILWSSGASSWVPGGCGSGAWSVSGSNIYYTGGSVGIGTALPVGGLQVSNGVTTGITNTGMYSKLAILSYNGGTLGSSPALVFENTASASGQRVFGVTNNGGSLSFNSMGNDGNSYSTSNILSLNYGGAVAMSSLVSAGTQCVQASAGGTLTGTGSACGSGGGGSPNPSALTCSTSISTTVLTAETNAAGGSPCIYGINDSTYSFTSSPTVTITGAPTGNGTYCLYIDPTGAETMQISSGAGGTFVGSSVTVLAVSSPCGSSPPFPVGSYEKATGTITASSTSWTNVADARPTAGNKASLTAGNGIATISNGQIATDTSVMQKGAVNAITGTINLTAGTQIESNSSSLPATCVVGQTYFLTGTTAGQNWYGCTATNTWTLQSGGSVDPTLIQYTSVHLTSSQIKNLTTVPITLIAAPGANKYIELVSVSVVYLYGTTTYTAGATTFIGYGNGTSVIGGLASGFATTTFTGGVSQVSFQAANQPQADSVTSIVNQPITTANFTTDFATGDGTAYVHLSYRVVPTNN